MVESARCYGHAPQTTRRSIPAAGWLLADSSGSLRRSASTLTYAACPIAQSTSSQRGPSREWASKGAESLTGDDDVQRAELPAVRPRVEPRGPIKKTQPLTEPEANNRQAFLKNFWYAAALSSDVGDQPHGLTMFGKRFMVVRDDSGAPTVMNAACPHRGAPLDQGWVSTVQDRACITCPYHGWAFDCENGALRSVPANANSVVPLQEGGAALQRYPTVERGGFVWFFWGDAARFSNAASSSPPIPAIPELDDPNWTGTYGEMEFDCGYMALVDNLLDCAHIHFLHNGSFGVDDAPAVQEMRLVDANPHSATCKFSIASKPPNPLWEFTRTPAVDVTVCSMLPCTTYIFFELAGGVSFFTYVSAAPVSATKTVARFCLLRNFAPWGGAIADHIARNAVYQIMKEDRAMIEALLPQQMGDKQLNVRSDLPQMRYYKLRDLHLDMGDGVDPENANRI